MKATYLVVGSVLELIGKNMTTVFPPWNITMSKRNHTILQKELEDFRCEDGEDVSVIFEHVNITIDDSVGNDQVFFTDVNVH